MQERAACKSCLGITLQENREAKCQASDHSIVCKIALNSMSAAGVKTKDAEHSFVTWWGSMCCGGAWGQEVHQTSHAASHQKIKVKACNTLHYWRGEFCFQKRASANEPSTKKKNTQDFLISMTRLTHRLLTRMEESRIKTENRGFSQEISQENVSGMLVMSQWYND